MSNLIQLYASNMYSLLWVSYTSIKLLKINYSYKQQLNKFHMNSFSKFTEYIFLIDSKKLDTKYLQYESIYIKFKNRQS